MNERLLRPAIFAFLLLFTIPATSAVEPVQEKWGRLAERSAAHTIDHAEITFDSIERTADALRVKVKKGAINLHRCVVYYKNGQTAEITILNSIPQGGESKVIELANSGMIITRVILTYDTKNRATNEALIELWGRG